MATKALITAEQFQQLEPRDDARLELVDGQVVEVPWCTLGHTRGRDHLGRWLPRVIAPGCEVFSEQSFRVHSTQVRIVDVAVVSASQQMLLDNERVVQPFTPTLAIEIASASDSLMDLVAKALDYLRADTEMVWIVLLEPMREIQVLDRSGAHRILFPGDEVTLPVSLGGASIQVSDLFPPAPQPASRA